MFPSKDIVSQSFSFPKPIICYLMDTVKGNMLKKLHKSCKYFYFKKEFTILDDIFTCEFCEERELKPYNIGFPPNEANLNFIPDNLWIINSLFLIDFENPSAVISKIKFCEIESLTLAGNITFKELKFLTKSGKIAAFELYNQIFDSDGHGNFKVVPPEDIMALIPKAKFFNLFRHKFTEKTMKNLISLERPIKIGVLYWFFIEEEINVNLMYQFLEKHLSNAASFVIWFIDIEYNEAFSAELCEKMKAWEPKERLPTNFPNIHFPIPYIPQQNEQQ